MPWENSIESIFTQYLQNISLFENVNFCHFYPLLRQIFYQKTELFLRLQVSSVFENVFQILFLFHSYWNFPFFTIRHSHYCHHSIIFKHLRHCTIKLHSIFPKYWMPPIPTSIQNSPIRHPIPSLRMQKILTTSFLDN